MNSDCKARLRNDGPLQSTLPVTGTYTPSSGPPVPIYNGPHVVQYEHKTISDVVCKNYQKRIASGEIINNPCTMTVTTINQDSGSLYASEPSGGTQTSTGPITSQWAAVDGWENIWASYPEGSTDHDLLVRQAKLRALSNIDNTPYQFGEDIGEIRETLRFLKNPISSLVELSTSFRRTYKNNRLKYRDISVAHANAYLQYRFALRPLLRSSSDALNAIAGGVSKVPLRRSANGFSNDTWSGETQTVYIGNPALNPWRRYSTLRTQETQIHATILYEFTNPVTGWRREAGLRAKDIPHTIWQLMPYSFVIDRAIDISSAIAGLTNLSSPSLTILAGSTTTRDTVSEDTQFTGRRYDPWTWSITPSTHKKEVFTYDRVEWTPSAADLIPPFHKEGLVDDVLKVTDLLALFLQNMRK